MTLDQYLRSLDPDDTRDDATLAADYNARHGWSTQSYTAQSLADALVEATGDHAVAQSLLDTILSALAGSESPSVGLVLDTVRAGGSVRLASPSVRPVLLAATTEAEEAVLLPLLRDQPLATAQAVAATRAAILLGALKQVRLDEALLRYNLYVAKVEAAEDEAGIPAIETMADKPGGGE